MLQNPKFQTKLKPLTLEGALQLRNWRNNPEILQWMEYQEVISETAQREWFGSLKEEEHYFEIWLDDIYIGMIHLRKNDEDEVYESGVIIGVEEFRQTGVVFEASLLLLDWAISNQKLPIQIKTHQRHQNAIQYNEYLGFKWIEDRGDFNIMELDVDAFQTKFMSYF